LVIGIIFNDFMVSGINISIRDEDFSGHILNEIQVNFSSKTVTVKEIIENRVREEVALYNHKASGIFNGLVEPSNAEKMINGVKLREKKIIDPEKQVYVALDAFQKNGFFLLVDNIQSESLDQEVELQPSTIVSFLKLTPLVGG
jgi:hypothetical protein